MENQVYNLSLFTNKACSRLFRRLSYCLLRAISLSSFPAPNSLNLPRALDSFPQPPWIFPQSHFVIHCVIFALHFMTPLLEASGYKNSFTSLCYKSCWKWAVWVRTFSDNLRCPEEDLPSCLRRRRNSRPGTGQAQALHGERKWGDPEPAAPCGLEQHVEKLELRPRGPLHWEQPYSGVAVSKKFAFVILLGIETY